MKSNSATPPGTLYLVATPIGNLADITLRALQVLKTVDLIVAEDTRHAKKLLEAHGIHQPLMACHQHNEAEIAPHLLQRLKHGESIALISDAGTPLIQDPGFPLMQLVIQANLPLVPIPGACALITALCGAGVPCHAFLFAGFLPPKTQARCSTLNALKSSTHTLIFYESTHRLQQSLRDIEAVFGPTYEFVLAKELTKAFEHFSRGTAHTILQFLQEDPRHLKGEFVLLLPPVPAMLTDAADSKLLTVLLKTLPLSQAVEIATKLSETPKKILYQQALVLQKGV